MGSPITWRELLDPAIQHAREGFPASAGQRRVTASAPALFAASAPDEVRRTLWPIFHPDRLAEERFVQPDLARTLELIAAGGAEGLPGRPGAANRSRRPGGRQPADRGRSRRASRRLGRAPARALSRGRGDELSASHPGFRRTRHPRSARGLRSDGRSRGRVRASRRRGHQARLRGSRSLSDRSHGGARARRALPRFRAPGARRARGPALVASGGGRHRHRRRGCRRQRRPLIRASTTSSARGRRQRHRRTVTNRGASRSIPRTRTGWPHASRPRTPDHRASRGGGRAWSERWAARDSPGPSRPGGAHDRRAWVPRPQSRPRAGSGRTWGGTPGLCAWRGAIRPTSASR